MHRQAQLIRFSYEGTFASQVPGLYEANIAARGKTREGQAFRRESRFNVRMTIHQLCTAIDKRRRASTLTAAVRVFMVNYFRAAATEEGHAKIGHGALYRARARRGPPRRPRA